MHLVLEKTRKNNTTECLIMFTFDHSYTNNRADMPTIQYSMAGTMITYYKNKINHKN